jgi:hypothetical protein
MLAASRKVLIPKAKDGCMERQRIIALVLAFLMVFSSVAYAVALF